MIAPADERDDLSLADSEEELVFADEEERLPWLESGEDEEEGGVDSGRIIAFAAVGLLALVLIVGAIWWFTRGGGGNEQLADGSTIEAPEGPYKTRPDDPGGREVEGTGDTSYEVAEGQRVEGRVAGVPMPSIDREQAGSGTGAGASGAAATGGVGVQVGAYSSREQAQAGWNQLVGRYEALQGVSHRIVEGQADSGIVYRLQAVAGDGDAADALCASLKAAGGDCQVKR